jgi:hypothetical protein
MHVRQVIVGPGDVLYVPPFYWHSVETLGPFENAQKKTHQEAQEAAQEDKQEGAQGGAPALSVSVLSPSAVEYTLAQAYWYAISSSFTQDVHGVAYAWLFGGR